MENFEKQMSVETLIQASTASMAWRIRDLLGIEKSHEDALGLIKSSEPLFYVAYVKPVCDSIVRAESTDEPEENFEAFIG